jgi:hypothetical protein
LKQNKITFSVEIVAFSCPSLEMRVSLDTSTVNSLTRRFAAAATRRIAFLSELDDAVAAYGDNLTRRAATGCVGFFTLFAILDFSISTKRFGSTIRVAIIATIAFFIKVYDAVAAKRFGSTICIAFITTIAVFIGVDDAVAAKWYRGTGRRTSWRTSRW